MGGARCRLPPAAAALVLLLAARVGAYPTLWENEALPESLGAKPLDATTCLLHPTKALGKHGAPTPDTSSMLEVIGPEGQLVTSVCPGDVVLVHVHFSGGPRRVLLTTSVGEWQDANTPSCPGAAFSSKAEEPTLLFNRTLVVPCNASTERAAVLKVTSATAATAPFRQAQLTLPIVSCEEASHCRPGAAGTAPTRVWQGEPTNNAQPAAAPAKSSAAQPKSSASAMVAAALLAALAAWSTAHDAS